MPDISFAPGVVKEVSPYTVGNGWVDSSLMRFRAGHPAPVGGWKRIGANTLSGVCRCIKQFSNLSGSTMYAFGTNSKAYILASDVLYDITPSGFQAGLVDASVATGFGIGGYGLGTYGTPRAESTDPYSQTINQPLIWSLDNFGQDLILCPYGDLRSPGHIYIWHSTGGFSQKASLLSADPSASYVPEWCRGVFVNSQTQQLIAVGSTPVGSRSPDPMYIAWSDISNPYLWLASPANSAGAYRLASGSYIVGWLNTYYETLFWTDTTIYSMQFLGNSFVYGFNPVYKGASMIAPKAAATNGSTVFWMDKGSFYQYNGSVTELACPLKEFLFGTNQNPGNINQLQAFKIHAAHNHSFSEVAWYYPSTGSSEIDSYVIYNYLDGWWANGVLSRTAWSDEGSSQFPIATDADGLIYSHENGPDANGSPLPYYITSGDMTADNGQSYVKLSRIIPDFTFYGSGGKYQRLAIDFRKRNNSTDQPAVQKTLYITSSTSNNGYLDARIRGRRVSIKLYNPGVTGTAWTLGKFMADFSPDGKR